jgi:hypothetical protein
MASAEAPAIEMPLGDWRARVSLRDTGRAALSYVTPQGARATRLPKDVAMKQRAALEAVKARMRDIERAIAESRVRLERSFRDGRDWRLADWRARYGDHPLARTLARRLIWRFSPDDGPQFDALGAGETLVGEDGAPRACPAGGRVRLWRPAHSDEAGRAAWRRLCLARGVRQPFFQAWRPVYELTAPELKTATYSNRFAGLIFDQPVLVRTLRQRGWTIHSRMQDCVPKRFAPARLPLPAFGLVAEYWGHGMGAVEIRQAHGAPNLPYFASSQIRFYRETEVERPDRRPMRLDDVPPRAFGETLFDIDLVSGVCAVGWLPGWRDPGPDAEPPPPETGGAYPPFDEDVTGRPLSRLGEARRDLLADLLPRLAIGALCSLEDRWLKVRGQWQDYAIHCGNASVRLTASNRHVCIVPARGADEGPMLGLPVAGDDVLSLILSKATLLADEPSIRDEAILRQIRPRILDIAEQHKTSAPI